MQALLYADLVRKMLTDTLGGQSFSWPKLVAGEDLTIGLRFVSRNGDTAYEVQREVVALRASIGVEDARPTDGLFQLYIGNDSPELGVNVTTELAYNATADLVAKAIKNLTGIPEAKVWLRSGSYWIEFEDGERYEITAYKNTLFPVSFVKSHAWEQASKWMHTVRLTQSPLAFVDTQERILPQAPSVTRIRGGGTADGTQWNEVQSIYYPPNFRGTYQLALGLRRTAILDPNADGPEEVQAALNAIAPDGGTFEVTNPGTNLAHIEFSGDYFTGSPQELLELTVFDAPEGDVTFTLSLSDAPLLVRLDALSGDEDLVLPLEIEAVLKDVADPDKSQTVKLLHTDVTIQRPVIWPGLALIPHVDWLRPPQPRRYVPFGANQVNVGLLHRVDIVGDESSLEFVIDHGFDTEEIIVAIRENQSNGKLLSNGVDYTVSVVDADSIRVDWLTVVPGENAIAISTMAIPARPVYQPHTHSMAEIDGLTLLLNEITSDVAELKEIVPAGALTAPTVDKETPIAAWILPPFKEVYPSREIIAIKSNISEVDLSKVRASGLLPAIHVDDTEALPLPLPEDPSEAQLGKVYENTSDEVVELDGDLGRRSSEISPGEFLTILETGDRLSWYRVAKINDDETSWYPVDFIRELFMLSVNERQFRVGTRFEINFGFEAAILKSNTKAQWTLLLEWGQYEQTSETINPGTNLKQITWSDAPILEQIIDLTAVPCTHVFGCKIAHSLVAGVSTISASRIMYGAEESSASKPATARFALRARLVRFDTEDSQLDPRGFVAISGLDREVKTSEVNSDSKVGKATILRFS